MAESVPVPLKLTFNIDAGDFQGEGPVDAVSAAVTQFIAARVKLGLTTGTEKKPQRRTEAQDGQTHRDAPPENGAGDSQPPRGFRRDKDGLISLTALPQGRTAAADAILLTLYGYHVVDPDQPVFATTLMRALKRAGARMDRIDRTIGPYRPLINPAGNAKARTYMLNNQGVNRATEMLHVLLNGAP